MTHGHCHPQIVSAIQEQAGKLNQIIFAGYTHDPAEEVAALLLKLAPRGVDHVFFSYSKGLAGGALPLAVTLCRADIFDAHYSKDRARTFFHWSSYAANLGACGAAKANLDLWQDQEAQQRVARSPGRKSRQSSHSVPPGLCKRPSDRTGTITALDLKANDAGYLAGVGPRLGGFLGDRNLLLRPLGKSRVLQIDGIDRSQIFSVTTGMTTTPGHTILAIDPGAKVEQRPAAATALREG